MRQKMISIILVVIVVFYPTKVIAESINVKVNDKPVYFELEPVIYNGNTMVSVRELYDALGAEITWNEEKKRITGKKDLNTVVLEIGSYNATVNEVSKYLNSPISVKKNKAVGPLRFLSESFGAKVEWNQESKTIDIDCNKKNLSDILFWDENCGDIEKRFECAKNSTPELITFLRKMPKGGDLHNHVSGATYSEYILESAEENNLYYDLDTNLFVSKSENENQIDIDDLKSDSDHLSQFLDNYSMRGYYPNTTNGHDQFFDTFKYINSSNRTENEMIFEIAKRNIYENVNYLELMVNSVPDDYKKLFEKFDKLENDYVMANMDKLYDDAIESINTASFDVNKSISDYLNERENYLKENGLETGVGKKIDIRYIQQLKRSTNNMGKFFISAFYSAYAVNNSDNKIVGVNIVQAEDTPYSREYFDEEMKIMDFIWSKMNKPNFAIHAGELVLKESTVEAMQSRITDTIDVGHAKRIGHGISIPWENDVPSLIDKMKNNNILIEICLSSNEGILGVKGKEHPFIMYRKAGVNTVLSTDDEGVSRGNLTEEYRKAVERYNLSYEELKDLARNSIEYSFLPGMSLYIDHDYNKIIKDFTLDNKLDFEENTERKKLLVSNPKMERQFELEKNFMEFEKKLLKGDF